MRAVAGVRQRLSRCDCADGDEPVEEPEDPVVELVEDVLFLRTSAVDEDEVDATTLFG
jgi:hypothetical protein